MMRRLAALAVVTLAAALSGGLALAAVNLVNGDMEGTAHQVYADFCLGSWAGDEVNETGQPYGLVADGWEPFNCTHNMCFPDSHGNPSNYVKYGISSMAHSGSKSQWWLFATDASGTYQIATGLTPGNRYHLSMWFYRTQAGNQTVPPSIKVLVDPTGILGSAPFGEDLPDRYDAAWGNGKLPNGQDIAASCINKWTNYTKDFVAESTKATIAWWAGESGWPEFFRVYVDDVTLIEITPQTASTTLPAGWNLISLPSDPADPDPIVVFAGLPINDQLVRWDPTTLSYVGYWDVNPAEFGPLKLGAGYWLYLNQSATISYQGYPQTVTVSIPLPQAGWHMIGHPHTVYADVRNTNVKLTGSGAPAFCDTLPMFGWYPAQLRYWEVGCEPVLFDSTRMQPWEGYWYNAPLPNLTLSVP